MLINDKVSVTSGAGKTNTARLCPLCSRPCEVPAAAERWPVHTVPQGPRCGYSNHPRPWHDETPAPSDDVEPQLCPNCAVDTSDRTSTAIFTDDDLWWIQCECGLSAPTTSSREGAIAQWNMLSMLSASAGASVTKMSPAGLEVNGAVSALLDDAPHSAISVYEHSNHLVLVLRHAPYSVRLRLVRAAQNALANQESLAVQKPLD